MNKNNIGTIAISKKIKEEMSKNNISLEELCKSSTLDNTLIKEWYFNTKNKDINLDVLANVCCTLRKKIDNLFEEYIAYEE